MTNPIPREKRPLHRKRPSTLPPHQSRAPTALAEIQRDLRFPPRIHRNDRRNLAHHPRREGILPSLARQRAGPITNPKKARLSAC